MKLQCPKCGDTAIYNSRKKVFECKNCNSSFEVDDLLSIYSRDELEHELSILEVTNIGLVDEVKTIRSKINKNICNINTIQFLLKYIKDDNAEKKTKHKHYMEIGDAPFDVGLNNKRCKHPVAICKNKNCYLAYKDIRKKKCTLRKCHFLEWME